MLKQHNWVISIKQHTDLWISNTLESSPTSFTVQLFKLWICWKHHRLWWFLGVKCAVISMLHKNLRCLFMCNYCNYFFPCLLYSHLKGNVRDLLVNVDFLYDTYFILPYQQYKYTFLKCQYKILSTGWFQSLI